MELSELYSAVIDWVASTGVKDLHKLPGVWHGKTEQFGVLGPLDVRINAHSEECGGIPPFGIKIGMDDYFPGLIALMQPNGGMLMHSPRPGEDESGLIEHFKQQTRQ